MDLGPLVASLGCDTSGLRQAQSQMRSFGIEAESQFTGASTAASSCSSHFLELAGAFTAAYSAYRSLSSAISYGMQVETLGVAAQVVAKNFGISNDALDYFTQKVKAAGITSKESLEVITKAMVQGLDLNQMKDLATRARDIAVVAGKNTSDTFATIMHGIESGRTLIFHTLGIAVRDQKTVFDEYAQSVGKSANQLNIVEKRQATLNEVMRASAGYAGAAAAADQTAGKQLASLDRVIKDTYESFWTLFGPGVSAGILEATVGFKELQKWALANQITLADTGASIGYFISQVLKGSISIAKFAISNAELVKGIAQLYIAYQAAVWLTGLGGSISALLVQISSLTVAQTANSASAVAAAAATVEYTTATIACTTATAAQVASQAAANGSMILYLANVNGAITGVRTVTPGVIGLGSAATGAAVGVSSLATAVGGLITNLLLLGAAGGIYGAYKTMTEPGSARSREEAAVMSGVPGLEYVAGTTDKQYQKSLQANIVGPPTPPASILRARQLEADAKKYMDEVKAAHDKAMKEAPSPPGKGEKGAENAADRVRSMMDTLDRELAKITEGSMAESVAWAAKMLGDLDKLQTKGADVSEAIPKVWQVALAKTQKLQEDFNKWYAGSIGDNYVKIQYEEDDRKKNFIMNQKTMAALAAGTAQAEADEAARTGKVQVDIATRTQQIIAKLTADNIKREGQIEEVANRQRAIEDINRQTEQINLNKTFLDQMGQLAPTLDQQNAYKRASLDLENQLAYLAIDKLLTEKKYLEPLRDQLYAQQALVNQAKLFNLEMSQNKGFQGWAYRRAQTAEQRNTISDLLNQVESGAASSLSEGFYSTLANDQSGMQQLAQNLGKTILAEITKANWTMLWDRVSQAFKPEQGMTSGNLVTYEETAAAILRSGTSSTVGGQGGGGTPLYSPKGLSWSPGSSPGNLGGGGGGGEFSTGSGLDAAMAKFAPATEKFFQGADKFQPGSFTLSETAAPALIAAGAAGQKSATEGMMSNMQLGVGAAGLGLSALGLLTGSQGLVTAGMVLQTAAVAIQIAAMIMKATGFLPGAAHGAILGGSYIPIHSFAAGAPKISAPTLAWVGEGPSEEAVIPLQQGRVPVQLTGGRREQSQLVYAPTLTVGDNLSRDDKDWLKRMLWQNKNEVYEMLRTGDRNFVKVKR